MENSHRVFCILCKRSEETKVTGPLSSKENVTAHQNCLLYSSGIWSEDSPQEDDLFGFSVADVTQEVKRGKKLKCHKCKRGGATCGCEFRPCRKSYHYPCAVEDGALSFEETKEGQYGIYCPDHRGLHNDDGSANRRTSSAKNVAAPRKTSGAGAVKGNCLTCDNKEGKVPLDSLSSGRITGSYCEKHAPSSYKDPNGESSGVGMSESSSDANSTKSVVSKRPVSSDEDEDVSPVRNKSKRRSGEHPLNSAHEFITSTGTLLFPPIDDDDFLESAQDSTPHRGDGESPAGSSSKQGSGNQPDESRGGEKDGEDDDTMDPGDESQSLLAHVQICLGSFSPSEFSPPTKSELEKAEERPERESSPEQSPAHSPQEQTTAPSVPLHSSTPPSPHASKPCVTDPPPRPSSASPAPPEPISRSPLSSTPSTKAPPPNQDPDPDPEPAIDSASFWKNCNTAGCTQAMFSDFMKEMNEISERIQSEQASQTDYDLALKVMSSSGQLEKLVTKQQQELQKKQRELEEAVAAMSEVVSALQR